MIVSAPPLPCPREIISDCTYAIKRKIARKGIVVCSESIRESSRAEYPYDASVPDDGHHEHHGVDQRQSHVPKFPWRHEASPVGVDEIGVIGGHVPSQKPLSHRRDIPERSRKGKRSREYLERRSPISRVSV